jgi:glycosyltransferase involved in cell wall biosynthesis
MRPDLLVLSRYGRLGASSRVRTYQYLPRLGEAGITYEVRPLFDDAYVAARNSEQGRPPIPQVLRAYGRRFRSMLRSTNARAVWIEYEALPWLPYVVERWLYRTRTPVIVDYDDAIFHRYDAHESMLVRRILGAKIDRIMASATVVIAGNAYLAERARAAGARRIEIVPSVIDLARYRQKSSWDDTGAFVIGWIGSRSTAPYLRMLESAARALSERVPLRIVNVGGGAWSIPGIDVRNVAWSEASEIDEMLRFDAGVMPLPDEPWTRGKCGYKLIQYMGCALPTVASPVGVNADIVEHGKTGFLATTPEEWRHALESLARAPELRRAMGQAGFAKVAAEFSLTATAPRIASIVRSVL